MTRAIAVAAAWWAVTAAASPAAWAQAQQKPGTGEEQSAEALAREGVDKLLQALRAVIQTLPQYEMPKLNERGDIIIRRVNPPPPKAQPQPAPGGGDETRT